MLAFSIELGGYHQKTSHWSGTQHSYNHPIDLFKVFCDLQTQPAWLAYSIQVHLKFDVLSVGNLFFRFDEVYHFRSAFPSNQLNA